jgi:hypothetical protein
MREQEGWDEHARFMDELVASGFILLGGPLENGRETLHIVSSTSAEAGPRAVRNGSVGSKRHAPAGEHRALDDPARRA